MGKIFDSLMGAPTCVVNAGGDPRFDILQSRLLRLGSTPIVGSSSLFLRCPPEAYAPAARLFFIDVDLFVDKGRCVDALLEFRLKRPRVLVCLASDSFVDVDLGFERIMICDGSFSKNAMTINVVGLLRALEVNNAVWNERLGNLKRSGLEVEYASKELN